MKTIKLTSEEATELVSITNELANASRELARRLEVNELVNRPGNPGNEYDQPAYDNAKAAYSKWESFCALMRAK